MFATGTAAEIQEIKQIKNVKFLKKSKILDILVNDYNLIKKKCPNSLKNIKQFLIK